MKPTHPLEGEADVEELRRSFARRGEELRNAKEQLSLLESDRAQLASIVEGSRDAIWSWNAEGIVVRWNKEAERLLGYAREEIVGQSLLRLVPSERWPKAREIMASVMRGAWYGRHETRRVRKDGSLVDVELTVSPIADETGRIVGASTMCRDITERKQFEASLGRRVAQLACLYRFTERLQRASSFEETFAAALDAIGSALGCERASILLFDRDRAMRFVAWRGLSDRYRAAVDGHSPWTPNAANPSPIYVPDINAAEESEALKETIRAEGIRALAFIPLIAEGRLIGKFMTYHPAPHAFTEEEASLANTIARQLALAVAHLTAIAELKQSEERFRQMSEDAPVMIWMSDANNKCLHLNRALRAFWGVDEASIPSFDWRTTTHPEDAPQIGEAMMKAVAERSSVTVKGRYLDAKRRYRVLQTNTRPHFSPRGEFLGMIGVNVDVTEHEEAAKALRESEERFRLAVEAAPSGMLMSDESGRIILGNAQCEKLFGYSREELIGQSIELLVPMNSHARHPELRKSYLAAPSARAMGLGRDLRARRKDGTEFPVEIGLSPISASQGVMTLAAVVDISSRKQAEADRELLIAELNHRVKNTLSIVQGLAHQTFQGSDTDSRARKAFEGRLVALALAHNLLTQTNWEHASLAKIANVVLNAGGGGRIFLSGPPVLLPPKEALSITIALHELFTNAVKYGALSNDSGRISLEWKRTGDADARLELTWREIGGPMVAAPKRRGFGSRLLERTLAYDLDGEVSLDFDPAGLICFIAAPLAKHAGAPQ